ncbi:hypothetical protein AB0D37_43285 [Streptomyces sp. NPDC048384]|uniref:hypothetical protein n=1 Tax=Streptomyces sp. NPDC048384 TaxID=3155487 RepID=UPI0034159B51
MYPAATRDPAVTLAHVEGEPGAGEAIRWTWSATPDVQDRAYACVADTYEAWGAGPHLADMLAELAADYVEDLLKLAPAPYVALTAMIEGRRATVSVIAAPAPEPVRSAQLPTRAGALGEPSWGRMTLTAGPCLYASVNLINIRPGPLPFPALAFQPSP